MTSDGNIEKKIEAAQATIELTLKKKSKLLELVALDSITPADFKSMTAQCNADIKAAEQELAELREQQESSEEFRSNMERIGMPSVTVKTARSPRNLSIPLLIKSLLRRRVTALCGWTSRFSPVKAVKSICRS